MSCPHPPAAQYVDRARGTVTCTICGEVVNDQHLELDPAFARASDAISKPANAMRQLGVPRPTKMTGHVLPTSHRPSVEVARRAIKSISRTLHISDELVDKATGLYKIAVNANVVAGARTSVLCACLYAICRREGTSHMLYDFADATKECPYKILRDMKSICHATHTVVPVMDLSVLVIRLAEELDLGGQTS
jgi:transcription factor IIIB subunit 2